jgi:serine/threonine protein phosphatase PrpC
MEGRWRGEGAQDQGARPYQEDSWAVRDLGARGVLAVLADGMGGHKGGAVASRLAVDAAIAAVQAGASLGASLDAANRAIGDRVAREPALENMGCTLIVAVVKGDTLNWISVGDSPLYLVAGGKIARVNADHSMAPQLDALAARGAMTAHEAATHPARHSLREAVMGHALTLIDEGSRPLSRDARLLVCSDGVQSLDDRRIGAYSGASAQALIDAVLALRVPHQDNVTVVKLERDI